MATAVYLVGIVTSGLLGYLLGVSRAYGRVRRSVARAGEWLAPRLGSPAEAEAVERFLDRVETELR